MTLKGKTALVTGATTGIGEAVARRLARDGSRVVVTGRDQHRGQDVSREIQASGGQASFVDADLADLDDVRQLVGTVGPVDILVNNAGVFPGGLTADTTETDFDLTFDVNVRAPFFLVGLIAPQMAANGGGAIINISSMAATMGMAGLAAYGASKAAIESLTKTWTAEYAADGVRVNAVAPGPTRTVGSAAMGEAFEQLASSTPVGRGATVDEIAATVSFLASDDASFIYGAVLAADGGRVAI